MKEKTHHSVFNTCTDKQAGMRCVSSMRCSLTEGSGQWGHGIPPSRRPVRRYVVGAAVLPPQRLDAALWREIGPLGSLELNAVLCRLC